MFEINEIKAAICDQGISSDFIARKVVSVFVGYDWISDDEADSLDSFFVNKHVLVIPFGDSNHLVEVNEESMPYETAMSRIGMYGCGDFIVTDRCERFIVIFDSRNIYVFGGKKEEVDALKSVVPKEFDIEHKYQNKIGDFAS